jgi:hypothetical protein
MQYIYPPKYVDPGERKIPKSQGIIREKYQEEVNKALNSAKYLKWLERTGTPNSLQAYSAFARYAKGVDNLTKIRERVTNAVMAGKRDAYANTPYGAARASYKKTGAKMYPRDVSQYYFNQFDNESQQNLRNKRCRLPVYCKGQAVPFIDEDNRYGEWVAPRN